MLDSSRLLVLEAVVRAGSVSRAAQDLGYSASAVSQQIAALEREVGASVLERHARGVRPTPVGSALAARAGQLRELLQGVQGEVDEYRRGERGLVRVASFASATVGLVAPAALDVLRARPAVQLTLQELEPARSLPLVAARELDVALVFAYPSLGLDPPAGVTLVPLLDDPLVLVVPADHPATRRPRVALAELSGEAWVHGHDWGPQTRLLQALATAAGFTAITRYESDSYEVQLALVAAGLGVALVPRLALGAGRPGVAALPLDEPSASRRIFAATPQQPHHLAAVNVVRALRAAAARARAAP